MTINIEIIGVEPACYRCKETKENAEKAAKNGIKVVQSLCAMVEHRAQESMAHLSLVI